jgi:hypothetical protein
MFVATDQSPQRLLTSAHDWQQACSRAFAAELLAPAKALEAQRRPGSEWEDEGQLANRFDVSPWVIAHQLVNHGLG